MVKRLRWTSVIADLSGHRSPVHYIHLIQLVSADSHRSPFNTTSGPAPGDALIKILLWGTVTMAMLMLSTGRSLLWTRGEIGRSLDWRYPKRKLLRDFLPPLDAGSPNTEKQTRWSVGENKVWSIELTHLLSVVGCVGEHGGHVKHQLVVLIGGVERVCARGVSCNTGQESQGLRPQYKRPLY